MDNDEKRVQFEQILSHYRGLEQPGEQTVIVDLLRETQDIYHYIPRECYDEIADAMQVKPAFIIALVKCYPSLKSEAYRHLIKICIGVHCTKSGASDLLKQLETMLQIKAGEVTGDGKFKLTTSVCQKNCGKAPNLRIDNDIYSAVQPDELVALLKRYR